MVIAVSSGSSGIQVLAQALGVETIRVPNYTFAGSALPLLQAGSRVVLEDVSSVGVLSGISGANHGSTASLVVAPFGEVKNLPIYPQTKGPVIYDLAAALGNCLENGFSVAGRNAVFSLHATKIVGAGEGGLVIAATNNLADDIRARINFGFAGTRESSMFGHNMKMSEYGAAVALGALDNFYSDIDPFREKWFSQRSLSKAIEREFNLDGFAENGSITPYWILDMGNPENLANISLLLQKSAIETRRWWPSVLSDMPSFSAWHQIETPNSKRFASTHIGLPFSVDMSHEDWERIHQSLGKWKGP